MHNLGTRSAKPLHCDWPHYLLVSVEVSIYMWLHDYFLRQGGLEIIDVGSGDVLVKPIEKRTSKYRKISTKVSRDRYLCKR